MRKLRTDREHDRNLERIASACPHLLPVLHAKRCRGVTICPILQRAELRATDVMSWTAPFIAIIGDDEAQTLGPSQYDTQGLEAVITRVHYAAVVACELISVSYGAMSFLAREMGLNTLIIETRSEQEIAWIQMLRAAQPGIPLLCCSVRAVRQCS